MDGSAVSFGYGLSYTKFRAVESTISAKTCISYAYDLQVFFNYLLERNPALSQKTMKDISLHDRDQLVSDDIEEYLKYYKTETTEQENGDCSIARKMSSLRSFLDSVFMVARHFAYWS